jgi:hypothetical protein
MKKSLVSWLQYWDSVQEIANTLIKNKRNYLDDLLHLTAEADGTEWSNNHE